MNEFQFPLNLAQLRPTGQTTNYTTKWCVRRWCVQWQSQQPLNYELKTKNYLEINTSRFWWRSPNIAAAAVRYMAVETTIGRGNLIAIANFGEL